MTRLRFPSAGSKHRADTWRPTLALGLLILLAGCDPSPSPPSPSVSAAPPRAAERVERGAGPTAAVFATGDLADIRQRAELRILVPPSDEGFLPRDGSPYASERALAAAFARELNVTPRFIPIRGFENLLPALLAGQGDLVARNLTVTPARRRLVAFNAPVALAREQLVTRKSDAGLASPSDLSGRRLAIQRISSFWDTARELESRIPDLSIEIIPDELDMEAILYGVESGRFDVAIADSNFLTAATAWHPKLRVAFDLSGDKMIAWAMRPESEALRRAADRFLVRALRADGGNEPRLGDLDAIRKRGVLRVLTRNSGTTYFLWRGQLMGFEYEMAQRYADELGTRLEMVVPPAHEDLIPWLQSGRGDVIAAGLSSSPERETREGIVFTRPYNRVREVLVARANETELRSPEDLDGRTVVVRASSSYWTTLEELGRELAKSGVRFELVAAPEEIATENIIAGVGDGTYDLTVADSHIAEVELAWRDDVRIAFDLDHEVDLSWAVRPGNVQLRDSLNDFVRREYRGLFYNISVNKYFRDTGKMRRHSEHRTRGSGQISPWDDMVHKWAGHYGFDWRLVVAQMYQESRFDPNARSFAGASGLLQVMPRTGKAHGFEDLDDPETGLQAGLAYLSWVRDRFAKSSVHPDQRMWFTLAAYNAGVGHVRDARRIAEKEGLDPDIWFGNVERAILLKEKPEVYKHTRFGYCRGSEPVKYVRGIHDRYEAYLEVSAPRPHPPKSDHRLAAGI